VFSGQIVPVQFVPTPGTAARDSNSSRDLGLGGDVVALSGAFRFLKTAFRGKFLLEGRETPFALLNPTKQSLLRIIL
jgi:hypothetical protein